MEQRKTGTIPKKEQVLEGIPRRQLEKKGEETLMVKQNGKYYGVFDGTGELRWVGPYLEWAFNKVKAFGWGDIYEIEFKVIGKEIL